MTGTPFRDDLLRVLAPFAKAVPLPRSAYVDESVLELEERAFLSRSWVPVAHEADLARPGDWVRAPLREEHVVVVRDAGLGLTALHAVCAHRGTLLCAGDAGRLPELQVRCPYHGWTYATDGRVLEAPGGPPLAEAPGLARARVATFAGVVFVNLDQGAAPLEASWQGGPPWLARAALGALQRVSRQDHEVRANWKALVGNFQESHHFPSVHPGLQERTPWRRSSSVVASDAWLGGVMDLAAGCETVSVSGRLQGRPFVAAEEDRRKVHDALVFPLWLTSLQPDYLLTYRLAPLAVDRTLVVAEIHVHAGWRPRDAELGDLTAFWERTNAEDRAICELQQRGLFSRHARASAYAASEDGLHAFERLVAKRVLGLGPSGLRPRTPNGAGAS